MYTQYNTQRATSIARRAENLFERTYLAGQIKRIIGTLIRKDRQLKLLASAKAMYPNATVSQLGVQPIPINQIVGTQGKLSFDQDFHPLQRRSKLRWQSVAAGMIDHPFDMPPIQAVRVGDDYYVIDGHHRVSAAKALGNIFIDGHVTLWDTDASTGTDPTATQ